MSVDDFVNKYRNTLANKKIINPLNVAETNRFEVKQPGAESPGYGQQLPGWLQGRKSSALDTYIRRKEETTSDLASQYVDKAAGQVPTDKFGIVQDKSTDFNEAFGKQLQSSSNQGKIALQAEEARNYWNSLQRSAENNAGYNFNFDWTPGAGPDNAGARAVHLAMQVYKSGTPYEWGGTSLTGGVDCSGLVYSIYSRLGINLPRSTYQQAKAGRAVPVDVKTLLPGDLVFYNTGSRDPNGIGKLSHVGIYIGNGQIIDARGTGLGVKIGSMNIMGGPVAAVRPW